MKVLITMNHRAPAERYLVQIFTDSLISQIRGLVNSGMYSQAAVTAFKNGVLEREIFDDELPSIHADLILSEKTASWDLMK